MDDLSVNFVSNDFDCSSYARYSSCYEECKKTIEDFLKEYKPEVVHDEFLLSSSTLGTSVTVDGIKIEDYFNDDVRIVKYCLARIDEIEAINRFSHTPSAFGCILSFLAFLGQATHNSDRDDELHFKEYCNKHLQKLRCIRTERKESSGNLKPRTSFGQNKNTWGEVLYRLVRCGLIHALSPIGNRDPTQNEIEIRLTHSHLQDACEYYFRDSSHCMTSVLEPTWSAGTLIISAFDFCDAVRGSICHIFSEGSDRQNMRDYFTSHPPLMAVIETTGVL